MGMMMLRLVLSLAFVVALLWFAARVAKKRGMGTGQGLIEVLSRQPLSRSSQVSVIRVAGKVMVLGATEQQVTLLGEVDPTAVEDALAEQEAARLTPAPAAPVVGTGPLAGSVFDSSQWARALNGLRERTVRRR